MIKQLTSIVSDIPKVLTAFILFLVFTELSAWAERGTRDEWVTCKVRVDCVVARSACGWPQAINKKFKHQYEEQQRRMARVIRCGIAPKHLWEGIEDRAVCEDSKCGIKEQMGDKIPKQGKTSLYEKDAFYCVRNSDCVPEDSCRPRHCVNTIYNKKFPIPFEKSDEFGICCQCEDCARCIEACSCSKNKCHAIYERGGCC